MTSASDSDTRASEVRADVDKLLWSVVIISRNEENNIERCIQSVVAAFETYPYEMILVDAASSDRTVEIAEKFDIHILRLVPGGPFRPSVGRHVGFQKTRAKRILFLDGDMTLDASWVPRAEDAFASDDRLCGVAGEMKHLSPGKHEEGAEKLQSYPDRDYVAAAYLSGSAAYKREPLLEVGGFNPFMRAYEEAELGLRLQKAGYRLLRLRIPMTMHLPEYEKETMSELFRRLRRGYFVGTGQLVRHAYQNGLPLARPVSLIQRYLQFSTLLLLGIAAVVSSLVASTWMYIVVWLALVVAIIVVFSIRSGSFTKPAYYFAHWFLASPHVLWGLIQRPRPSEEFPPVAIVDGAENVRRNNG